MTTPPEGLLEVLVESIGARGDGIARDGGKPVYVPYVLPGERVRVKPLAARGEGIAATLVKVLTASAERVEPPCPLFGRCGGCALQHASPASYRDWKRARVATALHRRGLHGVAVADLMATPPASRRRATLMAARRGKTVVVGFHQRAGKRLVDLTSCAILEPALFALIAPLRESLGAVLRPEGQCAVQVNLVDTGADILIRDRALPGPDARQALAALADRVDAARLSWCAGDSIEPIAWRRPALVRFGEVTVEPPPGAFLQASREGEKLIQKQVADALRSARAIADLYAGLGSLSLPLAGAAAIQAVEADAGAVAALDRAVRAASLTDYRIERRDLARSPLAAAELARFDAVLFDPPRAGALDQARMLAASRVPLVVAVSCDPESFARDARVLIDGGYELESVQPIDQFVWSAEVELVAGFRRKARHS